jgi:site-specific DNA-methyltransferase (adenine-specific)
MKPRPRGNHHPTVKPTDLMRYLCRLVTPPGGTVLDPFMGSGSTGKGSVLEGFRFIGIEREADYFEIACKRIEAAQAQPDMFVEPAKAGIHGEQVAMELTA